MAAGESTTNRLESGQSLKVENRLLLKSPGNRIPILDGKERLMENIAKFLGPSGVRCTVQEVH
jgi:hypothetical protein